MTNDLPAGKTITATELKKNLGLYLDYVADKAEVIISKNGKKLVRMLPYQAEKGPDQAMQLGEGATEYSLDGSKVSYAEFMRIYESSELRLEFIDGEIYLLASPSFNHQRILGDLYMIMRQFLQENKCMVLMAPFDVHFFKPDIKDPDVCQPDLLVACDLGETVNEKGRYMGVPSLVIEIMSASSQAKDMVRKLNTYMLSGVREYWIVDPAQRMFFVYSFQDHNIASYDIYKETECAQSRLFAGLSVSLTDLFKEAH